MTSSDHKTGDREKLACHESGRCHVVARLAEVRDLGWASQVDSDQAQLAGVTPAVLAG